MSQTARSWSRPLDGLPLIVETPAGWSGVALADLDALLADHAHCEQKAASAALALIGRFPDHPGLARGMMALAHEELRHFRQVLDLLERRGKNLGKPGIDLYVRGLREWSFRNRGGLGALGDILLVNAFVEARSCERFRILAEAMSGDPGEQAGESTEIGIFYRRLADAEARHWELFRDLAEGAAPKAAVARRLEEMAEAEGEIVVSRPREPRMH